MSNGRDKSAKRQIKRIQFVPLIVILAFAWGFSILLINFDVVLPPPVFAPINDTSKDMPPEEAFTKVGPYLNTIIFVGVIAISGVTLLFAISRFGVKFRYIILGLIWIATVALTSFYALLLLAFISVLTGNVFLFSMGVQYQYFIGLVVASTVILVLIRGGEALSLLGSCYFGAGMGVLMGASIPFWTTALLFFAISGFDVFAVRRGHLRVIGNFNQGDLMGLMVEFRGLGLGVGDIFFYSLLVYFSMANFGLVTGVVTSISMLVGFGITLLLLKRKPLVPALPAPILLGITSILMMVFV